MNGLPPHSPLLDEAQRRQRRLQDSAAVNPIRVFGNRSSCIYRFFLANIIILSIASCALFILHGRHYLFTDYAYGCYYIVIIILMLIYKPFWIPILLMLNYKCGCSSIHKARSNPCVYKTFNYIFWGTIGNPIISFSWMFVWSYYIFVAILEDSAVAVKYEIAVLVIESWICLLVIIGGLLILYQIRVDTNFVINYVRDSQIRRSIGGFNNSINNDRPILANTSDMSSIPSDPNTSNVHSNIPSNPNNNNLYNPNNPGNLVSNENDSLQSVPASVSDIESQLRVFRRSNIDSHLRNANNRQVQNNERPGRGNIDNISNPGLAVIDSDLGVGASMTGQQQNGYNVGGRDYLISRDASMGGLYDTDNNIDGQKKETLGAVQVSEKLQTAKRTKSKQFLGDWFSLTKSLVIMLNQNEDECAICCGEYEYDDEMAELVCKHQFHRTCIIEWLMENPTCPCCRTRAMKK